MFAQVLGHNWQLFTNTAWFRETIRQAILTDGRPEARQLRHASRGRELLADELGRGRPDRRRRDGRARTLVNAAYDKYATLDSSRGYSASLSDINALRDLAQAPASAATPPRARSCWPRPRSSRTGWACCSARVSAPGGPSGTVPGDAVAVARHAGHVRRVHAGRRADVHGEHDGQRHLHRGRRDAERRRPERHRDGPSGQRHVLAGRAAAGHAPPAPLGAGSALANVGGSSSPTSLLTYSGPASNDAVTLTSRRPSGPTRRCAPAATASR